MKATTGYLFLTLLCALSLPAKGQLQETGNRNDSIAQAKVVELLESKHVLSYYDANINVPGDFIYSSQIETLVKKRPGKDFSDYWIQVKDHRRYEGTGVFLNFYVDPASWEVSYYDTETNLVWSWEQWGKQSKYKKS